MDQLQEVSWNSSVQPEEGLEALQDGQTLRLAVLLLCCMQDRVLQGHWSVPEGVRMNLQHITTSWSRAQNKIGWNNTGLTPIHRCLYWAAQTGPALSTGLPPALTEGTRFSRLAALQAQPRMWSAHAKPQPYLHLKQLFLTIRKTNRSAMQVSRRWCHPVIETLHCVR